MKLTDILCGNNRKLLLIFSGWSTDARLYEPVAEVVPKGWDVAVVTVYGSEEYDFTDLRNSYDTIYVLAWSLGVAAADALLPEDFATALIAVNGTTVPASDEYSIPEAIYDGTLEHLDARNLKKFQRRMFADSSSYKETLSLLPDAETTDIDRLKAELRYFRNLAKTNQYGNDASQRRYAPRLSWTRQYVSDADAIIPAKNQIALWESTCQGDSIITLPGGHHPDFKAIVASILPNPEKISESFRKAHTTYDENAEAQEKIAAHLASSMETTLPSVVKASSMETTLPSVVKEVKEIKEVIRVLEIGAGTGLFTRKYLPKISNADATFLDLYPITPFHIADKEKYIVADGEEWISHSDEEFDLILSTSAVQWFANPRRFFEEAYNHLHPGGALIFSTFVTGNLYELDSARLPMLYRSSTELTQMLNRIFPKVYVEEEPVVLEFDNLREALMHLKHTGVKGSHQVSKLASLTDTLGKLPHITLTYRPAYFICQK